jgi:hypothetical protein
VTESAPLLIPHLRHRHRHDEGEDDLALRVLFHRDPRAGHQGRVLLHQVEHVSVDDHFGVGAVSGTSVRTNFSQAEELDFVGPTVAFRAAPRGSYGLVKVSAAYARGQYVSRGDDCCASPPPRNIWPRAGVFWNASGAWLFHPWALETGPVAAVDVTTWGSVTFSANWALGLALP